MRCMWLKLRSSVKLLKKKVLIQRNTHTQLLVYEGTPS